MENNSVRRDLYDKILKDRNRWRDRTRELIDKCRNLEKRYHLLQDRCDTLQFMLSNREDGDDDGD